MNVKSEHSFVSVGFSHPFENTAIGCAYVRSVYSLSANKMVNQGLCGRQHIKVNCQTLIDFEFYCLVIKSKIC